MTRDYQYNFSEIDDSMFDESQRITKAKKTISVLEDFLTETNNLTLLDIGCSSGIMTYEYAKKFKKIIAIDIDKQAINYAKTKKSKIKKMINLNAFVVFFHRPVSYYPARRSGSFVFSIQYSAGSPRHSVYVFPISREYSYQHHSLTMTQQFNSLILLFWLL